jgi:hypothetical protein
MALPNDYTFCPGTTHQNCAFCKRQRPSGGFTVGGYMMMRSSMTPPIDLLSGRCPERIPEHVFTATELRQEGRA